MEQATTVWIPVELATVERLDAIAAAVREAGDAGRPRSLDSYTSVLDWATDIVLEDSTAEHWARAEREQHHRAATLGPLVLIEVDAATVRGLDGALGAWPGEPAYVPTYGTVISWYLNVARWSGHPAPGED